MKYRNATPSVIWGLISSFVSPVWGFIFNVALAVSRKRVSHVGLSLSIVIMYSYLPVMWDARNNFVRVFYYPEDGLNFYTHFLYILTHNINMPYILAYSIISFSTVLIFSKAILGWIVERRDLPYAQYAICLALFFMCLEYRSISDLQKTTFAIAIGLLSFDSKFPLRYILAALSITIHPFATLMFFAAAIAKVFNSITRSYFALLMIFASILAIVMSPDNLLPIVDSLPSALGKVVIYLNYENSRFSSEGILNFVLFLRYSAFVAVCVFCFAAVSKADLRSHRVKIFTLFIVSLFGVSFSSNEVFSERIFILVVVLFAYSCARVRFPRRLFLISSAIIFFNVFLHGAYTIYVSHQPDFRVVGTEELRTSMSTKPLYLPTIFLILHDIFGYSDDLISENMF